MNPFEDFEIHELKKLIKLHQDHKPIWFFKSKKKYFKCFDLSISTDTIIEQILLTLPDNDDFENYNGNYKDIENDVKKQWITFNDSIQLLEEIDAEIHDSLIQRNKKTATILREILDLINDFENGDFIKQKKESHFEKAQGLKKLYVYSKPINTKRIIFKKQYQQSVLLDFLNILVDLEFVKDTKELQRHFRHERDLNSTDISTKRIVWKGTIKELKFIFRLLTCQSTISPFTFNDSTIPFINLSNIDETISEKFVDKNFNLITADTLNATSGKKSDESISHKSNEMKSFLIDEIKRNSKI